MVDSSRPAHGVTDDAPVSPPRSRASTVVRATQCFAPARGRPRAFPAAARAGGGQGRRESSPGLIRRIDSSNCQSSRRCRRLRHCFRPAGFLDFCTRRRPPRLPPIGERMRLTLLGAGHIGRTIARLLAASGDYDSPSSPRRWRARTARVAGARCRRAESATRDTARGARATAVSTRCPTTWPRTPRRPSAKRLPLLRPDRGRRGDARDPSTRRRCGHRFMPQCGWRGLHRHRCAPSGASFENAARSEDARWRAAAFPTNALKYNLRGASTG